MQNNNFEYIFKSERLGFRNWMSSDIPKLLEINSDKEVMLFFPEIQNKAQTESFIKRMQQSFKGNGYCYFAVDELKTNQFIGFIGLANQNYDSPFSPFIDIGWRLHKNYWNKGYATEGAKRCLKYAFQDLNLENIKAIAPEINTPSINVMEKIGMKKELNFIHSLLIDNNMLKNCVCYEINSTNTPFT